MLHVVHVIETCRGTAIALLFPGMSHSLCNIAGLVTAGNFLDFKVYHACSLSLSGIPKLRTTSERASASQGPAIFNSKPVASQQPASGLVGQPTSAASKLPVKGLPTSLSSTSLGSNENNGAMNKGEEEQCVLLTNTHTQREKGKDCILYCM